MSEQTLEHLEPADHLVMQEILAEVNEQRAIGYKDQENKPGLWVSYIVNYASRWALPWGFDASRYTFRACMIKVAALALSAIRWYDNGNSGDPEIQAGFDVLKGSEREVF